MYTITFERKTGNKVSIETVEYDDLNAYLKVLSRMCEGREVSTVIE